MIKLNLGSHDKIVGEDWVNVDILNLPNVDILCNLAIVPFQFQIKNRKKVENWDFLFEEELEGKKEFRLPGNFVDEILVEEVLEHLSFRITTVVLKEIYRILKVGGILKVQVPDCGKAMEAWVNKKICKCVPHKPEKDQEFKGKSDCLLCHGNALMDWERWLFSFTGAQKHEYDLHRAIFTKDILESEIRKVGFERYNFIDNPVKLKVECIKT